MEKENHPLYDELAKIVGSKYVTYDDFTLHAYSYDSSCNPPGPVPGIAVLPGTTEEVAEIVKLANRTKTSIVPRGGGANIHGYVAGEPGRSILVDMTRMTKIIEIDTESKFVTAECGIILSELEARVKEKGFHVNTAAMPAHVDTLGGVMSGQEGGGQNLELNSNWRYVLGFKVVLPDGSIIQTGAGPGTNIHRKNTFARQLGAPDVTGLFLGDCGTFGIKTEATLQIFPLQKACKAGSFVFDTFDDKWRAISNLMAIESNLQQMYTNLLGLPPEDVTALTGGEEKQWGLIYAVRGIDEDEVGPRFTTIENICKQAGGRPGCDAFNKYAKKFYVDKTWQDLGPYVAQGTWQGNELICPKQEGPKHFLEWRSFLLEEIKRKSLKKYGFATWSLLTPFDGGRLIFCATNLFFNDSIPGAREAAYVIEEKYRSFVTERGVFTENNQGRDADAMAACWSPTFRSFMRVLKKAIDPNQIMNPGVWARL